MKFDVVVGNPPYQEENKERNRDDAIYPYFMESAFVVGSKVLLITPGRFLFNAGGTSKKWNNKMLSDTHLKVSHYESDSSEIFSNTDIKGGVAITYRDSDERLGPIGVFTKFSELNLILKKVSMYHPSPMSDIIHSGDSYKLTDELHDDFVGLKNKASKGHEYDVTSNIFKTMPEVFFENRPSDSEDYLELFGRERNNRISKWIKKEYIANHPNKTKYKVFLANSSGSGKFGEAFSEPVIGQRDTFHTQTFISIGAFNTETEAQHTMKYIKTKFLRAMIGVLKVTQANTRGKWKYVPLQDFTESSDIDWSQSIADIDQQLYKKYGLNEEEITFIETHVKEMK